jgi:hypothetical protein
VVNMPISVDVPEDVVTQLTSQPISPTPSMKSAKSTLSFLSRFGMSPSITTPVFSQVRSPQQWRPHSVQSDQTRDMEEALLELKINKDLVAALDIEIREKIEHQKVKETKQLEQVENLEQKLAAAKAKIRQMEQALEDSVSRVQELSERFEGSEAEMAAMLEQDSALEERLNAADAQNAKLTRQIEQAHSEYQTILSSKDTELKAALSALAGMRAGRFTNEEWGTQPLSPSPNFVKSPAPSNTSGSGSKYSTLNPKAPPFIPSPPGLGFPALSKANGDRSDHKKPKPKNQSTSFLKKEKCI